MPLASLRFSSPQEEKAAGLLAMRKVTPQVSEAVEGGGIRLHGQVQAERRLHAVSLRLDADLRMVDGSCECDHYLRNRLYRGPCEHMLALRMADAAGQLAA